MASTDARPVAIKGQPYRTTFPLFASDGSMVLGATLLSQISIDAASAVYGARPVEITANMGLYYLDLTAGEMNGQTIAIIATPSSGGSGANVAPRPVPIIIYTQGPTSAFYAQVMSVDATPLDGIASTVWASPSRSVTTFANIVNAVWATPTRALTDWTGIVNAVWATPSRTLSSFGTLQGDVVNAVWATPTRALSDWAGIVNTVWATPSRTLSSIDNVKASVVSSVWATPTRTLSAGVTVAAGGIDSTSFAASAVDAAAFAQDAAREVADEVLNRDIAGSASGGARIVRDALRVLRNKVDTNLGIVYQENDSTTAWTFTTTSDALATRLTGVDPA